MITVFTPCYNQGEYLGRSIESVLAQTMPDFEYIIVNDGSTDKTAEIASEYAIKDKRISFYSLPKQEQLSVVLNYGIKKMNGDVFVWVPADDTILPELLAEKKAVDDGKTVWYSWFNHIDTEDRVLGVIRPGEPEDFFTASYNQCFIGFTGIWIPKNAFAVAGLFPEHRKFISSEDYYWMLKASKLGVPFRCVNKVLYNKRLHGNRTSARCEAQIPEEVRKIKAEINAVDFIKKESKGRLGL